MNPIKNRYDFVYIFDVQDGNPNGDPDAGNLPRLDPETGRGLITDVCLKRKTRNFVELAKGGKAPFEIYVREKAILNDQHARAYKEIGAESALKEEGKKRKGGDKVDAARKWMCSNFYDIRAFGAVMSIGINCGQVRGPIQMTFARSVDPVVTLEHSITRMAVATQAEAEKQSGDNRTMGRKNTIPYGVYVSHGFISAPLAAQTGFSEEDLELFWQALGSMFEHDRSAARGLMSARKLIVFKHDDAMGSAPAHKLFDLVSVKKVNGDGKPARAFSDYKIEIDKAAKPERVEIIEKI
ncbi:MAG TPA: type I-C CRISPR-associated protein Cas7/Csd2 [Elusimicrobiales bacterium]|nr:type I-C CRISPR-associated protein Cas7/Csd2 [Elusimicrobiales bacterium]